MFMLGTKNGKWSFESQYHNFTVPYPNCGLNWSSSSRALCIIETVFCLKIYNATLKLYIYMYTRRHIPVITNHKLCILTLTVSCAGTLLFSSVLLQQLEPESTCAFKAATPDSTVHNLWPISFNIDNTCFCDSSRVVSWLLVCPWKGWLYIGGIVHWSMFGYRLVMQGVVYHHTHHLV